MLLDSNIRDQAYQFFIQESLEFLQLLEEGLLNLKEEHETPHIHSLMRAAHSIKGGAASVGLEAIKKIAHQMEDVLRALYKDVPIDDELEELLLQAYDCLRTPLVQQIQTGESDAEQWLEQSEVIFAQLVEKLGDAMFGDSELPTAAELGIDIVEMIFGGDVEVSLVRLESILADPDCPEIAGEMRAQSQVFIGMGELVNLMGFVELAKTAEAAIEAHPEHARTILTIAVRDFRVAQAGVLAGDRTTGGSPSAELLAWTSPVPPTEQVATETTDQLTGLMPGLDLNMWADSDDDDDFASDDFGSAFDYLNTNQAAIVEDDDDLVGDHCQIFEPHVAPDRPENKVEDDVKDEVEEIPHLDLSVSLSDHQFSDWTAFTDDIDDTEAPIEAEPITESWSSAEAKRLRDRLSQGNLTHIHADVLRDTLSNIPFETDEDDDDEVDLIDRLSLSEVPIEVPIETQTIPINDTYTPSQLTDSGQPDSDHKITEPAEITQISVSPADLASAFSTMSNLSDMMDDVSGDLSEMPWPESFTLAGESGQNPAAIANTNDDIDDSPTQVFAPVFNNVAQPTIGPATIVAEVATPINTPDTADTVAPTPRVSTAAQKVGTGDAPMLSNSIRVDLSRLERLNNLVGEMVSQENSAILQNQQLREILTTMLQRVGRFDHLTRELRNWMDGSQTGRSQISAAPSNPLSESGYVASMFDPLQMDNYSDLSMLMQETVDEVAQIGEAMRDMTLLSHHSQQTQRQKQQTLRQVRNDLLWARMLPIGDILQRFPRMIRDMSNKYSKTIAVKLTGTNTLVDKATLEKLYDPLVHLVRNGFDHGIEPPEQREELGKPKEATLEIRAFHRGNQIYIEVIDDGRGINTTKVLAKAITKGLITAEVAETLSREQIYDLLFAPGFSTTDIISDLSGRGVGLDTVKTQIKSLKGNISITSEPGQGTTFTMRLPLTLTITKLLVFSIKSQLMAVPVDSLLAIVAAPVEEIQSLKNGKFFHWQEQFIPIYPQSIFSDHYALNNHAREQPNTLTLPTKGKVPLLMLAGENQTIALPVDAILYEQELAIKPFSKTIAPPSYLYGCTLLGDGALVPVMDAQMLISSKQMQIITKPTKSLEQRASVPLTAAISTPINNAISNAISTPTSNTLTILVIDDSLTTRQTLASVLQKAGYRTLQARDGREALEQLAQNPEIQAAFCDIEMPKMNGFEFLNACRQERTKELLPVIMLSSRSNEKHRQVAKYMGANEYLTKPFFEHELLKTLVDLLSERSQFIRNQANQAKPCLALAVIA
jgi:two-component system, chemotaxis family, sensor histidine kinase and response regulator PixL